MRRLECDVVVVGAGPAGSLAARTVAEKGSQVILLEEHPEVGHPVFCAEGLSLGGIKDIAALILYNAFITGELGRARAYELCAMPDRSARRLIAQLKEEGLLSEISSRSPLKWEIPEHTEPWYFPQLMPGM